MQPVQFFLFGLFLAWFTGTGRLRALLNALQSPAPSASTTSSTGTGITIPFGPIPIGPTIGG